MFTCRLTRIKILMNKFNNSDYKYKTTYIVLKNQPKRVNMDTMAIEANQDILDYRYVFNMYILKFNFVNIFFIFLLSTIKKELFTFILFNKILTPKLHFSTIFTPRFPLFYPLLIFYITVGYGR